MWKYLGLIALCQLASVATAQESNQQDPTAIVPKFRDGDRVVWLGPAFVERMQQFDYLETVLTSRLRHTDVTFRNLGWSGDNIFGHARAVFGAPADGFVRLERDLKLAQPTWVGLCYGGNEAHRGDEGLKPFRSGLVKLLEVVDQVGAKPFIVSPRPYEYRGKRAPDPEPYNRSLLKYCQVMRDLAREREIPYVDMYSQPLGRLTDNGVHLTGYGYWRLAPRLADELGVAAAPWFLDVDIEENSFEATGLMVEGLDRNEQRLRLSIRDQSLTIAPPPADAPNNARMMMIHGLLRVRGLQPGQYALLVDGKHIKTASAEDWAQGQQLPYRVSEARAELLRQKIRRKNELFFHRHRPQNETYLFLFRKHEQGNNAAEIPQFDPLINEVEAEIRELKNPESHIYELKRADTA